MKWTVKLVLCFLIAWLPLTGFAAPALVCPHASSPVTASHMAAQHAMTHMAEMQVASPTSKQHQPVCQGGAGTLSCSVFAVPAEILTPGVAATPAVYARLDATPFSQFIPDLPQRPPRAL